MFRVQNRKKTIIVISVIVVLLAGIGGLGWYEWTTHTVRTVYVEGNVHYTQQQIREMVMSGALGQNSIYLSMKYKNRAIKDVPFLDEMDVKVLTPDTIKITVYEKALAGYVKYMDTYVYFDKDGYVVESSSQTTKGVPQVTGLKFDHFVLGEALPVAEEDREIFGTILDLTKLLNKYQLSADRIYFHSNSSITLYFDEARVALGNDRDHLEDKLMRLPKMLPGLADKKGTLQMENYSENGDYSFKPDQ